MRKTLLTLITAVLLTIPAVQTKDTIEVSVKNLKPADALTIAKEFGYQEAIPDPADNTKTIVNPQSATEFLNGHLERLIVEVLINAKANEKAQVERKAEEDRIKARIEAKTKAAASGGRNQ